NGGGPLSGSFRFITPRRLTQLDAFNGGSGASTVTLSCTGQPTVSVSLAVNELRTILTNWSGTCDTVTLGSSNGWNTNFDRLVISGAATGGTATATPTSTPTATTTPTPTRTPTPTATPTSGAA